MLCMDYTLQMFSTSHSLFYDISESAGHHSDVIEQRGGAHCPRCFPGDEHVWTILSWNSAESVVHSFVKRLARQAHSLLAWQALTLLASTDVGLLQMCLSIAPGTWV